MLRQETRDLVFPGVVRLTAVIHRDRLESTSPAENHRESDRWKTSGWEQKEVNSVVPSILFQLFISMYLSRQNHSVFVKVQGCPAGQNPLILLLNLMFDVTVVTVSHHLVFELLLYSDR